MEKIHQKINDIMKRYPKVRYGVADISFSHYSKKYKRAIMLVIPHFRRLKIDEYLEADFINLMIGARKTAWRIQTDITTMLDQEKISYEIPFVGQFNDEVLPGHFSLKTGAAYAGLGWVGKSGSLVTEDFGPTVYLAAVLVDAPLVANQPITQSKCPEDCNQCVTACPNNAIKGESWNKDIKPHEITDYKLCNDGRFMPTEMRKHSCGHCLLACPFGKGIEK